MKEVLIIGGLTALAYWYFMPAATPAASTSAGNATRLADPALPQFYVPTSWGGETIPAGGGAGEYGGGSTGDQYREPLWASFYNPFDWMPTDTRSYRDEYPVAPGVIRV